MDCVYFEIPGICMGMKKCGFIFVSVLIHLEIIINKSPMTFFRYT